MKRGIFAYFCFLFLPGQVPAQDAVDYLRDVKPLLQARCYACHGALKQQSRLRLDTGAAIRKGGRHGLVVKPGQPDASPLLDRVATPDEGSRMPPEGKPLTVQQVGLLKAWIAQGARSPADEKPEADPRSHWAFLQPHRPRLPRPTNTAWTRNPIDAFVAAEHARHNLIPVAEADKATLLRRVHLDLVGMPPTREELRAFKADPAPNAYEKVVDRLLASPRYAERWARHWMDVWRYSDWYGRRSVPDVLNSYAMIWRWRDWIIRSIQLDRGYDWMIEQMLAADEINPTEDLNLVATGFIVRNFFRWNYHQWKKDLVEHTGKAFLGLTLNCCQCHDHKYDPISQEEYFKFRAFFEPLELRHDRVPGEPDPGPYPIYEYGKAYGPIKSGMVRVFDHKLDAVTYLFARGDPRNKIEGKPPISPGVPAILGGKLDVKPVVLPVTAWYPGLKPFVLAEELASREAAVDAAGLARAMPDARTVAAAWELKTARADFLQRWPCVLLELPGLVPTPRLPVALMTLKEENGLADAQRQFQVAQARYSAAKAELSAFQARIAAEQSRYLHRLSKTEQNQLVQDASDAERWSAVAKALLNLTEVEVALESARRDPKSLAKVSGLQKQLAVGRTNLTKAQNTFAYDANARYTPLGPAYPSASTGRRAALARWIANRDNPLTARVAVNHVWAWHFGQSLVQTTANFGRNGRPPSNPELLDWLAVEFMECGWRHKPLHRMIVTSQAYRMGSQAVSRENLARDRDNRFLWHFPAHRMEAEVVRDSLLHLASALDGQMGGPEIAHEQGLASRRRSLYFAHHGEGKMLVLELFDGANACECYQRLSSVMPQQALALANSELTLRLARILARKLSQETGPLDEEAFLVAAFEQVLGRGPSAAEKAASFAFLDRQARLFQGSGFKKPAIPATDSTDMPATDAALRARENLVHVLFNHNDFVTIR
jgi:hypothetical protein